MKVLSILTLMSPDAAYGGPLRVALNQAAALQERGHDVTIVAGQRGYGDAVPTAVDGTETRLFPVRQLVPGAGFAGLAAPGMVAHLVRHARSFDVAHVHLARDLVTLPAAAVVRMSGLPYVVQPHGMIAPTARATARVLDPLATRPSLTGAAGVLYLTSTERDHLSAVTPHARLHQLGNGVPLSERRADPTTPEVLFLARLAHRKRPGVLVDVADALARELPHVRFRLVGPDEGEMVRLAPRIAASRADVAWEGPLDPGRTLARMSQAGVYVLPSVDEPWGMSVLEAMSVGLPVVITDSNGIADVVRRWDAGIVTATDPESVVHGVRSLLSDPGRARRLGQNGLAAVRGELGMQAIALTLEESYRSAVESGGSNGGRRRRTRG